MKNDEIILGNESLFVESDFNVCPHCGNLNLEDVVSNLNSTYKYCNDCGYAMENALKNKCFDFILKEIQNVFKSYNNNNVLSSIKIEVVKNNNALNLLVNNILIGSTNFLYEFKNLDTYLFESNISYLIEDYFGVENIKSDIIVC
ncbi:hypothetical protein CHF27_006150 [Romboutsia maritimum]|uniref:Uncharacterized protein n=1 Tax=Romboutsia maritimum TaxID=2020948 RepID=A0A371ITY6_9FIRM|nr:hypothetical protein [Romboutsia maritimum]RDY23931.1 hypothetical protein CHF27_006150 [Romboutsia maritimum]